MYKYASGYFTRGLNIDGIIADLQFSGHNMMGVHTSALGDEVYYEISNSPKANDNECPNCGEDIREMIEDRALELYEEWKQYDIDRANERSDELNHLRNEI